MLTLIAYAYEIPGTRRRISIAIHANGLVSCVDEANLAPHLSRETNFMPLFKFLNASDVHHLTTAETLRVCRQSHYRKMYEKSGDDWIGDQHEGRSEVLIDEMFIEKVGPAEQMIARRTGIGLKLGITNTLLRNVGSIRQFNEFIFCVAQGDFHKMKEAMCTKSALNPHPYDACLEIKDPAGFINCLMQGTFRGEPLKEPVAGIRSSDFSKVIYQDTPLDALAYDHLPLIKRKKFCSQSEARLIIEFADKRTEGVEVGYIHCPGIGVYLKEVLL